MSKMLDASALEAAERFTWLNARLIDRLRFAHLFRGGAAAPVVAALRPYQNADGGFGNALEPDFRGPVSQPATVEAALFFFNDTATTEIYTLSLHDALPIADAHLASHVRIR